MAETLPGSYDVVAQLANHSRNALLAGAAAKRDLDESSSPASGMLRRLYLYLGSFDTARATNNNPIAKYQAYNGAAERITSYLCFVVDELVLPNGEFLNEKLNILASKGGESITVDLQRRQNESEQAYKDRVRVTKQLTTLIARLDDRAVESETTDRVSQMTEADTKLYTRLMLELEYPHVFRSRNHIRRKVSIHADQQSRFQWFLLSVAVFLVAATFVDFNATTMHGYYRNRLAKAFLNPVNMSSDYPMYPTVSELRTTEYGGPYHLISCSVRTAPTPVEGNDDSSETQISPLVFSQLFCGSEETGYLPSDQYERYVRGEFNRLDLAEAAAISGAAVSPSVSPNWLTSVFMFVMNLRTGQWLPNPRYGRPRLRPVVWMLWRKLYGKNESPYLFASDGGHSENLGLLQLLKRRCKIIIAVDAGHDPKHDFYDLARVLRLANTRHGISIRTRWDNEAPFELDATPLRLTKSRQSQLLNKEFLQNMQDCEDHFIVADIEYPNDDQNGLLVYIKPSLTGDEDLAVQEYRSRSVEFPHESTGDQIYEDCQIEAYRKLGFHIGTQVAERLLAGANEPGVGVYESLNTAISQEAKRKEQDRLHAIGKDVEKLENQADSVDDVVVNDPLGLDHSDQPPQELLADEYPELDDSDDKRSANVAMAVEAVATDTRKSVEERLRLLQDARKQLEDDVILKTENDQLVQNLLKFATEEKYASLRVAAIEWLPHLSSRNDRRVKQTLRMLSNDSRHKKVAAAATAAIEKMKLPRR